MGKTVILKDLYDRLALEEIAVLALKADKLASSSIKELQDKIGLSIPIYDFIEECKQNYKTTVLVIDQIDALSQSMSSDRSYLEVFKNLVDQYLYDENIRVVISIRTFDLHYDPSLQAYKNIETVKVNLLLENQVLGQLSKLGIHKNMLTNKLLDLLKVPNHLNVFSRIYNSNKIVLDITTLQDMYQELWKQKVIGISRKDDADKKLTKELLYKIANQMYSEQHITVSELQFEDYDQELRYLESERLIKKEDHQLQFFHQSFYDFVFAKQFIENDQNLNCYIKENDQSILLRSAVKMMLSYLRDYSSVSYLKTLTDILTDKEILFHIKHLTLSSVLFFDKPTAKESEIIRQVISKNFYLCVLFFQKGISEYWFQFALNNSLLEILKIQDICITDVKNINSTEYEVLVNAALSLLRNAALMEYEGAWKFISELNDKSKIMGILRFVILWDEPLKYEIFEDCANNGQMGSYLYYSILNNIAKVNPEYTIKRLSHFLDKNHKTNNNSRDSEENTVLSTLAKVAPEKLINLLYEIVIKDEIFKESDNYLIGGYKYMRVTLTENESLIRSEFPYCLLGICLRRVAKEKNPVFTKFFETHKKSKFQPILRLLNFAIRTNEEHYYTAIFELSNYGLLLDELYYDSTLAIENRIIFEKAFPHFSNHQQKIIIEQIKKIIRPHEIFIWKLDDGKTKISSCWGLTKYCWIKRLPILTIKSDRELYNSFLELTRKFPNYVEKENRGHAIAGIVQSPLHEKAYQYMNQKQWLASFKKYNGTIGHFERPALKGDIVQHANAFKKAVLADPSTAKLEIIRAAINDKEIKLSYPIKGIWGWSESTANHELIIPLFQQVLNMELDENQKQECLYIAENLSGREKDNEQIITFLLRSALDFTLEKHFTEDVEDENETSIGNLATKGLNTRNGSAASSLVHIIDKNFTDQVFTTLEHILAVAPSCTKAAVYYQFAYLMNIEPDRAFQIFKDALITESDPHVLASSLWSLQYMGNYSFEPLIPVYKKLILIKCLGRDDSEWLFSILYFSFLHDKKGAEELLYQLIEGNTYDCGSCMRVILQNYYTLPGSKEKNDQILDFVMDKITQEDFDNYGSVFNDSLYLKLSDIKSFLKKYIQSPFFRVDDSLIEYLTSQCNLYPEDAVELFEIALQSNKFKTNDRDYIYSSESGVQFIVSAFNSLIKNNEDSKDLKWKLMLSFDEMLKDHRFKQDTDRILEELV